MKIQMINVQEKFKKIWRKFSRNYLTDSRDMARIYETRELATSRAREIELLRINK